jgi:simple sugar transport system permease protein
VPDEDDRDHEAPEPREDGGVAQRVAEPEPPEAPERETARAAGEETAEVTRGLAGALAAPAGWRETVLVPVLAVVTALAIGAAVIVFTNEDALQEWKGFLRDPMDALRASWTAVSEAYRSLFTGGIGSPIRIADAFGTGDLDTILRSFNALSESLIVAVPLMFAGLSVALGFRAGLFNIGTEGQITAGAIVGSMVGFSLGSVPGPLLVPLIVLGGFVGGAIWGIVPGILKAKTGAHEVIVTIMMNSIAGFLALYLLSTTFFQRPDRTDPISKPVEALYPRLFGSALRLHLGFLVAIGIALLVAWLLNRTTVGFQFRAVGANPDAARAAGMSPAWTYIVVMALAGGLGGIGGANQLLSTTPSLTPGFSSGYGFDGIALALLGRGRPMGVVLAAILFGVLRNGSRTMQAATQTPVDIVTIVQALIIMFIAAPALVRAIYRIRSRRARGAAVATREAS